MITSKFRKSKPKENLRPGDRFSLCYDGEFISNTHLVLARTDDNLLCEVDHHGSPINVTLKIDAPEFKTYVYIP